MIDGLEGLGFIATSLCIVCTVYKCPFTLQCMYVVFMKPFYFLSKYTLYRTTHKFKPAREDYRIGHVLGNSMPTNTIHILPTRSSN